MGAGYLQITDLRQRYGDKVVSDIDDLVIERGEVLAVIGPNGAGKSTLLKLIAQLEKPVSGTISFDGGVRDELDIRRRLAMVFQEPLLFSTTVFDNIAYGLKVRKVDKDEIASRVHEVAAMLGVEHLLGRASSNLSGGEAQRVSLARALVLKPELLLLDEPMASLDPPTKKALIEDLREVLDRLDVTVIYVTHQRSEAVTLADRIAVMDEGRIVQVGAAQEVLNYPVNEMVADLVGAENILKGRVTGARDGVTIVEVADNEIEVAGGEGLTGKVWLFVRPENVSVVAADGVEHQAGLRNHFEGEITKLYDMGPFYRTVVECGFVLVALVAKRSADQMGLRVGMRVSASFDATGAHVVSRE